MIAETIAKLRKSRGLTQAKMASALHVTQGAVSQWETGRSLPDVQQMFILADFFGVTVEELSSGVAPAPAPAPAPRPNPASGLTLEEQAELDQLTSTIGVMTRNNINPGTTDRKKLEHLRIAKKLFDNAWPENSTKAEPEKPQQKAPTPDKRAEAKALLDGMTDEQYQAALAYLKFLQSQKGG